MTRLHVYVREDLGSKGYQSAQAVHAAIDLSMKHPDYEWWRNSNTIVVHTVKDEDTLFDMYYQLMMVNIKVAAFCEPHLNYELTAIAVEPVDSRCEYYYLDSYDAPLLGRKESPYIRDEDLTALVSKLNKSKQNDNQTIMEHGASVRERTFSLIERMYGFVRNNEFDWKRVVPEHLLEGDFNELILDELHNLKTIWRYTLFHDCGKPDCETFDSEGKRHFPDHEKMSAQVWSDIGTEDEARLMLHDMDFHRMRPSHVAEYLENGQVTLKDMLTLLVVAYAELAANALDHSEEGLDSVSFKIKKKNLDKISLNMKKLLLK